MLEELFMKMEEKQYKDLYSNKDCPVKIVYGDNKITNTKVYNNIKEAKNILIFGGTGSGKSRLLHNFINQTIKYNTKEEVKLILVDPKQVEFDEYKTNKFLYCPIIGENDEFRRKLFDLYKELDERKSVLKNRNFEKARQEKIHNYPYIVIVVDELIDVLGKNEHLIFRDLLKEGYKYGIHFIVATQNIDEEEVDLDLYKQFKTIICQKTYYEKETTKLIGLYANLDGRGDSLLYKDGYICRVQVL